MFRHVFYTWLLTNLFQPIAVAIMYLVRGDEVDIPGADFLHQSLLLLIYSLGYSTPVLLLGWLYLLFISRVFHSLKARYLMWLLTVVIVMMIAATLVTIFGNWKTPRILFNALPGAGSLLAAILIRYRQFRKLYYSTRIINKTKKS